MKKLLKKEKSILYSRSKGEKVLFAIFFIVFLCYAVSLVYPFVWLIGNSLKTRQVYNYQQAMGETFRFPTSFEFEHYVKAFTEMEYNGVGFVSMFFNSIFYTAITTAGGVFFSALTGYCLSKYRFRARGIIYALAIFSLTMPVIGTTGATYKLIAQIGAYDTWLYPVLISLGGFGFNSLIMYGFFSNVSFSYAEAVFVDGGGGAGAHLVGTAVVAAGAGIHAGEQHEVGGEGDGTAAARDGDAAVFQGLAQRLERICIKLRQFVQKQHPAMRQGNLARARPRTAAGQPRGGHRMVRRAERPLREKRLFRGEQARHGVNFGNFKRFLRRHGGQNGRQPLR